MSCCSGVDAAILWQLWLAATVSEVSTPFGFLRSRSSRLPHRQFTHCTVQAASGFFFIFVR